MASYMLYPGQPQVLFCRLHVYHVLQHLCFWAPGFVSVTSSANCSRRIFMIATSVWREWVRSGWVCPTMSQHVPPQLTSGYQWTWDSNAGFLRIATVRSHHQLSKAGLASDENGDTTNTWREFSDVQCVWTTLCIHPNPPLPIIPSHTLLFSRISA